MPCGLRLAWKCLKAFYQFELTISAVDLFGEVNRHRQLDDGEPEQRAEQRREVHLDDVPNRMHLLDVAHESGAELKSSWDCRKGVLKNRRLRVKWFLPIVATMEGQWSNFLVSILLPEFWRSGKVGRDRQDRILLAGRSVRWQTAGRSFCFQTASNIPDTSQLTAASISKILLPHHNGP